MAKVFRKSAYVETRNFDPYDVSAEDLAHLDSSARQQRDLVLASCQVRLAQPADAAS